MRNRIDSRAITLIFGVIVALIVLLTVWMMNPDRSTMSLQYPFSEPIAWKEMGKMVLQSLF